MRKIINSVLVIILATGIAELSLAYDFVGYAYSLSSDKLVYTEHHRYKDNNEHVVVYREASDDAEVFATKILSYQDNAFAPSFQQRNLNNGEFIHVQRNNDALVIEYKENESSTSATQSFNAQALAQQKNLVIDAGFDKFINHHWHDLVAGKPITINYLIPARLDYYALTINQYKCQDEEHYCFEISASNFLINLFSSELKLKYNKQTRRLASFTGRSNISNGDGDYQDVNIVYQYADNAVGIQSSQSENKKGTSL